MEKLLSPMELHAQMLTALERQDKLAEELIRKKIKMLEGYLGGHELGAGIAHSLGNNDQEKGHRRSIQEIKETIRALEPEPAM